MNMRWNTKKKAFLVIFESYPQILSISKNCSNQYMHFPGRLFLNPVPQNIVVTSFIVSKCSGPGLILGQNCVQLSEAALDDLFFSKIYFYQKHCKCAMNIDFAQIRGALVIKKGCIGNKWVNWISRKKSANVGI